MGLFYNTSELPSFKNGVITIGTFDGVHLGHREILKEVVNHAIEIGGESIVITFEPHPRKLLFPDQPLKLITPLKQKLQLISDTGIQHIVVIPFTKEFSNLSAREYIEEFLVKHFHPESIVIGYDHHFGHDRTGNIALLKEYATKHRYSVNEISAQLIDDAAVSSTKIRSALLEGKVREAAPMMGRDYSIKGSVTEGKKLGRTIGYPTANILPDDADQLVPANGVYAVRITWNDMTYNGMLNIGYRPTVSEEKTLSIEVNIFDFSKDIYDEELEISFIDRLRDEQKFNSIDELKKQLVQDRENALVSLGYG